MDLWRLKMWLKTGIGMKHTEADAAAAEARHDSVLAKGELGLPLSAREKRICAYEAELDQKHNR